MSTERDVTRVVRSWLDDGATRLPDHVLDRVLADVPATSQRRRWGARRNRSMSGLFKFAVGAAAVAVLVAVVGISLLPRTGPGISGVPTAPLTSSPTPSPTSSPTASAVLTDMVAVGSEVQLSALVPAGWGTFGDGPIPYAAIRRGTTAPTSGMSVYFEAPRTTYPDPCQQVDPAEPVGTTVDDFVQALREIPHITTTEPEQTTFAGRPATYLVMTTDDSLPCSPSSFYIWDGNYTQGLGQVVRTWVLDVNGTRVVASALGYPEATADALAEQQFLLDSIEFK